eukprot:7242-Pleurochrysis_carterae.AAC.1
MNAVGPMIPFSYLDVIGEDAESTAAVDAIMVERLSQAVKALQPCASEQQRREYSVLLAAVAPPRISGGGHGKHEGMIAPVARRVGVPWEARTVRGERVQYAFDAAVDRRAAFDATLSRRVETA